MLNLNYYRRNIVKTQSITLQIPPSHIGHIMLEKKFLIIPFQSSSFSPTALLQVIYRRFLKVKWLQPCFTVSFWGEASILCLAKSVSLVWWRVLPFPSLHFLPLFMALEDCNLTDLNIGKCIIFIHFTLRHSSSIAFKHSTQMHSLLSLDRPTAAAIQLNTSGGRGRSEAMMGTIIANRFSYDSYRVWSPVAYFNHIPSPIM